jgi:hypothetical protein
MVRVIQSFQRGYTQLPPSYQPPTNLLPDSEARRTVESDFQPSEELQKENSDPQKSTENQAFQPSGGTWESQWESRFWEVWQALQAEKSNYWIGGNIFGITGGTSYQRLCERLDTVKARLG